MFAPTWQLLPRPAFDVETEAPCGTSVAEARGMVARWQRRMVQAELERWQLSGLARPLLVLIDWWTPSRGAAARHVAKHVLRASPVARMVAVAATAVTVTALAMLALVVVAIAQLV